MGDAMTQELWAVLIEAREDGRRAQWFLVPEARRRHGAPEERRGRGRFIKRILEPGKRPPQWKTVEKPSYSLLASKLKLELDQYESTGWELMPPVLIQLDQDDYEKCWSGATVSTPYKALRHVEAVTKKRGYRVTSGDAV